MRIADRVAIVTGASSGIGAAIAVDLARRNARVAAVARREDRLAQTVADCRKYSPDSLALPADVGSRQACEGVVAEAVRRLGPVDIVVNNAGISNHKHVSATPVEEVEGMMAVNFFGPVYLTMAALPSMLQHGRGSIVNVTSVAGYVPNPGEAAYGASKAALSRWSHGLAVDLHGSGVNVGVISPGPIDTEIWSHDEELVYEGRLHPPEIVARAVARMIETDTTHMTVPRRYGAVGVLYPLLGRPMRWGMRKYEQRAATARAGKGVSERPNP
jgi:short-subunit dehydrogenase